MKIVMCASAAIALLGMGGIAQAGQAPITGTIHGSYSPVQESNVAAWNTWFSNASAAIVAGQNSGGSSYSAYNDILDNTGNGKFDVRGMMVTNRVASWAGSPPVATYPAGFNSWMGSPTADGMYGNRFTWMYEINGDALDIRKVSLARTTNFVGKNGSTDWSGSATGNFSSDAIGFGSEGQDTRSGYNWNGTSWVEVTSGFIADRIIIRSGVGWNPDQIVGATNQQMLDGLAQQLFGEKAWSDSGAYRMLDSYNLNIYYDKANNPTAVTSSTITNAVPEPAFFQMGALLGMSGLGCLKLRRKA